MDISKLPDDLAHKFNWGACLLTWIWAIGNRSLNLITIILLVSCLIPYAGVAAAIALCVYSGRTGNRRAWQNKHWRGLDQFNTVQRKWLKVGVVQIACAIILLSLLPLLTEK